jgi:thioester reductase-like protein
MGLTRVVENLERYGLWDDSFSQRLVVLPGDLDEPRLGLSSPQFAELADGVDAIYNNGAPLGLVAAYDELKVSHVHATREILTLAARGRPKAVHHVSSSVVFDADAYHAREIPESLPPHESRGNHLGYAQCKWVTEQLVWQAAARGIPVTVHRPGFIAGSSLDGGWNSADFLCRLLKAIIEMGSMPGDLQMDLDFSPVDYVARSIVYLSRQPASRGRAFHLQHPFGGVALENFGPILSELGYPVRLVPFQDWLKELADSPASPLKPLLPFFTRRWPPKQLTYVELWERAHRPLLTCHETLEALAPAAIRCPPLDRRLIGRYLDYLARTGFIPPPLRQRA